MAKIENTNKRIEALKIFPMTLIRVGGLPLSTWEPLACGIPDWGILQKNDQDSVVQLLEAFDQALIVLMESPLRTEVYNARKSFFQRRKMPAAAFDERIRPEKQLDQLYQSLSNRHRILEERVTAARYFETNLALNFSQLQSLGQDEILCRALLFTSHDLLASLPGFVEKPVEQLDKKDRRTAFSLLQYLSRAVFKTSPLSRFTTVQVKALNAIQAAPDGIEDWLGAKYQVTPNVAILPAIYAVLLREPAFFQSLRVMLNPCVSSELSSARTWLYFDGEQEAFQKIGSDPVVEYVVQVLLENQRNLPFKELMQLLEGEVDASSEQVKDLLFRLIDIGLLEWQLPERGLSPGWCGGLYNYLGYLPSSQVLTEAAYLLQWMRTAARTMSFQSIHEAQTLQQETLHALKSFLEKHGEEMPAMPPEQIFFEDVMQEHPFELPNGVIEDLTGQLAQCWKLHGVGVIPPFRARLYAFAVKFLNGKERVDFLEFSRSFLEDRLKETNSLPLGSDDASASGLNLSQLLPPGGKVGALLQIHQENGTYKAIVNAMYPGAGKLFARWLPLFPAAVSEQIKIWHQPDSALVIDFPWQGWSNANFQPILSSVSLAVPDARVGHLPGGREILLADVTVGIDAHGYPQLFEKQSNQPILFSDLGLEAPDTRPPVIQVLWHVGVPFISSDVLLAGALKSVSENGIRRRNRLEYQSLVLSRAAWEFPQEVWSKLFSVGESQAERVGLAVATLRSLGIPRQFFGQFVGFREKPQYFDLETPISMLLLEKNLRNGSGNLRLTEMLPTPDQWLGDRVGEFVVEFLV